jgi:hypothetical protein
MKRYLQDMNEDERRRYRRWRAGWISFYVLLSVALVGLSSLLPDRGVEIAQNEITQGMSGQTGRRLAARPVWNPGQICSSAEFKRSHYCSAVAAGSGRP